MPWCFRKNRTWPMGRVKQIGLLLTTDIRLHDLVKAWAREFEFDVFIVASVRTAAEIAINWAKGREQQQDGAWIVVDREAVVTHVQHAMDSAHFRRGALDVMPLVGGKIVWKPGENY